MSRTVRLFALAVLALAVVTASGGFTAATADRGAAISVVEDDRMLLAVETRAPELSNGRHDDIELLTITNRFAGVPTLTTVRADVSDPDSRPPRLVADSVTTPAALSVGESGTVAGDVVCGSGSPATGRLVVVVTVAGDGVRFSATRAVTVSCTGVGGASSNGGSRGGGSNATAGSAASRDTGETGTESRER